VQHKTVICPLGATSSGKQAVCSGHGRCLSLRRAASFVDYVQFFRSEVYDGWDADAVHGCDCDEGWEGSSCSRRKCPFGDDPTTTGQVAEVQLMDCWCSGATCAPGTFLRLSFRGRSSRAIPYSASASLLKAALEVGIILHVLNTIASITIVGHLLPPQEIPGVDAVIVTINDDKTSICDVGGAITRVIRLEDYLITIFYKVSPIFASDFIQITFVLPQGEVPSLAAVPSTGLSVAMRKKGEVSSIDPSVPSVTGTKEYAECSNRGVCDRSTGTCSCFRGYTSSDGAGGAGSRGDCGHFYLFGVDIPTDSKYCPTAMNPDTGISSVCSGRGVCVSGSCVCNVGYGAHLCEAVLFPTQCPIPFLLSGGPGCVDKICPPTRSWFGDISADRVEEASTAACSGVGDCDGRTGTCR
jgi:hypothetical protein